MCCDECGRAVLHAVLLAWVVSLLLVRVMKLVPVFCFVVGVVVEDVVVVVVVCSVLCVVRCLLFVCLLVCLYVC